MPQLIPAPAGKRDAVPLPNNHPPDPPPSFSLSPSLSLSLYLALCCSLSLALSGERGDVPVQHAAPHQLPFDLNRRPNPIYYAPTD